MTFEFEIENPWNDKDYWVKNLEEARLGHLPWYYVAEGLLILKVGDKTFSEHYVPLLWLLEVFTSWLNSDDARIECNPEGFLENVPFLALARVNDNVELSGSLLNNATAKVSTQEFEHAVASFRSRLASEWQCLHGDDLSKYLT